MSSCSLKELFSFVSFLTLRYLTTDQYMLLLPLHVTPIWRQLRSGDIVDKLTGSIAIPQNGAVRRTLNSNSQSTLTLLAAVTTGTANDRHLNSSQKFMWAGVFCPDAIWKGLVSSTLMLMPNTGLAMYLFACILMQENFGVEMLEWPVSYL